MTTHTVNGHEFYLQVCPACGMEYLLPREVCDAAVRIRDKFDKGSRVLHCPDGHQWHFPRQEEDQRMASSRAEIERLAELVVDLEEKLAASNSLVRQLGGNVTAFPARTAR